MATTNAALLARRWEQIDDEVLATTRALREVGADKVFACKKLRTLFGIGLGAAMEAWDFVIEVG